MAEREKINLEVTEAREEMTGEIPAEIRAGASGGD